MAAVRVECPQCHLSLESPQPLPPETRLQCSRCGTAFAAGDSSPPPPPQEADAPPLLFAAAPLPEPDAPLESSVPPFSGLRRIASKRPVAGKRNKVLVVGSLAGALVVVFAIGITMALMSGPSKPAAQRSGPPPVAARSSSRPNSDSAKGGAAPKRGDASAPRAMADRSPERTLPASVALNLEQDIEIAKRHAAAQRKDLLLWFDGSDWSTSAQRLSQDVFRDPAFLDPVKRDFVITWLDFPQLPAGKAQVRDASQNDESRSDYGVSSIPTLVLADAQGRPYAYVESYAGESAADFARKLESRRGARAERDRLLAAVVDVRGAAQLEAASNAITFLRRQGPEHHPFNVFLFYSPEVKRWFDLASEYDPDNARGRLEEFFTLQWLIRVRKLTADNPRERELALRQLAEFKQKHKLKDANGAALMHWFAAGMFLESRQFEDARRWTEDGLALNPTDDRIREGLSALKGQLGLGGDVGLAVSAGTGFVVAARGDERLLLTNHHVIRGGGGIFVRLPDGKDRVPAEIVAQDPARDIALLRIKALPSMPLTVLHVVWERDSVPGEKKAVGLAEEIAVFGYPLAGVLGSGVKFTQGAISAEPDAENDHLLLLNCLVNPGNSGGPLCDRYGNVVGMVRAKISGMQGGDSYGQAIPASALIEFLAKHVPDYKPSTANRQKKEWKDIAADVKDYVLMIVRVQ